MDLDSHEFTHSYSRHSHQLLAIDSIRRSGVIQASYGPLLLKFARVESLGTGLILLVTDMPKLLTHSLSLWSYFIGAAEKAAVVNL